MDVYPAAIYPTTPVLIDLEFFLAQNPRGLLGVPERDQGGLKRPRLGRAEDRDVTVCKRGCIGAVHVSLLLA